MVKRVYKKLSGWEKKYIACRGCGAVFNSISGLKIHKSRNKCWHKKRDADIEEMVENRFRKANEHLLVPSYPEVSVVKSDPLSLVQVVKEEETMSEVKSSVVASSGSSTPKLEVEKNHLDPVPNESVTSDLGYAADPIKIVTAEAKNPDCDDRYIDPHVMGITQILEGSILLLYGILFQRDSSGLSFNPTVIEDQTEGIVIKRWLDAQDNVYLDVMTNDGVSYVCLELLVIPPSGTPQVKLIQHGKTKDLYTRKPIGTDSESQAFLEAIEEYTEYRDRKKDAETEYKRVDTKTRPIIVDYLEKYGLPSSSDQKDDVIRDSGWKVHYSYKKGPTRIERNDERIIAYLLEKNYAHALRTKYTIDEDVYTALKDSKAIPDSFVTGVEKEIQGSITRRLYVERLEKK